MRKIKELSRRIDKNLLLLLLFLILASFSMKRINMCSAFASAPKPSERRNFRLVKTLSAFYDLKSKEISLIEQKHEQSQLEAFSVPIKLRQHQSSVTFIL
jgi:hypothetical protein